MGCSSWPAEESTNLRIAVRSFPARWSKPAVAVAATLTRPRSVWSWCEALDDIERALSAALPPSEGQ